MTGDPSAAHLVPVNVLNLEMFARGLHADDEPAVDGTGRDAAVGSTHAAANDHRHDAELRVCIYDLRKTPPLPVTDSCDRR